MPPTGAKSATADDLGVSDENKTTLTDRARDLARRASAAVRHAAESVLARLRELKAKTRSMKTSRLNLAIIAGIGVLGAIVITALVLLLVSPSDGGKPAPAPTVVPTQTASPTQTPAPAPTEQASSPVSLPSGVQLLVPDAWKGVPAAGVDLAFKTPDHVGEDELVSFTDLGTVGEVTVPMLDETVNALTANGGSATAPTVNADGIGSFTVTEPSKTIYVWVSLVNGHGVLTTLTLDQADQDAAYRIADLVAFNSKKDH